jgi:hypothetical protein
VVHRLDLAQVIPLQKIEGLAVSGRVNAELPLEKNGDRFRVEHGSLRQAGPGTVSYQPKDSAGLQKAGLPKSVLLALQDFHYSVLEADLTFEPDGRLTIAMHLEGTSPLLDTDRSIHLNLSVEQNLLSLLKSLRYSESITREIEKRIQ